MTITLEQVDKVRERTHVSYQRAKEALELANGDVVEAIIMIEEDEKPFTERVSKNANDFGNEVIKTLKDLLNAGTVNRIVVEQKDGKVIMNIPVTVGALGALLLTTATTIALIAALATGCIIKIHKESGEVVNVNELASNMFDHTKEKASKIYEATKAKVKAEDVKDSSDSDENKGKTINVDFAKDDELEDTETEKEPDDNN